MERAKLILLEGIPGSGKSTAAQFVLRSLQNAGWPAVWWYEEQVEHPVYLYRDYDSMRDVLADLEARRFESLIERAVEQWRKFVTDLKASAETVILDSCLFGYLTWSLFPREAPLTLIQSYVMEVEQILLPCRPQLISFYQTDIGQALRTLFDRRGGGTEERFIQAATLSDYGVARQLDGLEGTVTYWQDYRSFTDELYEALRMPKLRIDNSRREWSCYEKEMLDFLGIKEQRRFGKFPACPDYKGTYESVRTSGLVCTIRLEENGLTADGLPHLWPSTPLLPLAPGLFDVQSLPLQVRFETNAEGSIAGFSVTGAALLDGPVEDYFTRRG